MGQFLSLSGVIGSASTDVVLGLIEFSWKYAGHMRLWASKDDDATRLVIAPSFAGDTILYPSDFFGCEKASEFLSVYLQKPTFSFYIHDGDLWMFHLYVDGHVVTAFNPIPDYWGDISEEEAALMRGNASVITRQVPRLAVSEIERYLVRWDLDAESPQKAYPDDEYSAGESWQLLDFMRKLGLAYPLDKNGEPVGKCFSFRADVDKEA